MAIQDGGPAKNKGTKTMRAGAHKPVRKASRTASKAGAKRKAANSVKRQSKPRTAYELLQRVCAHIKAEPHTYNQGYWGMEAYAQAECGTTCCRAGWIVALHDGLDAVKVRCSGSRAEEILGMSENDLFDLFYDKSMDHLLPGSTAYAKAGVSGLRVFMRTHAKYLKSRLLPDAVQPEAGR